MPLPQQSTFPAVHVVPKVTETCATNKWNMHRMKLEALYRHHIVVVWPKMFSNLHGQTVFVCRIPTAVNFLVLIQT